jgi:hypothetical protein
MTFIELMERLEYRLGYHQLPLNPHAHGIKDLLEGVPLHPELMTKLVRAIYSGNRCQTLTDPVTHTATLNALAPLRLEALRASSTDIDTRRLIDELCIHLDRIFGTTPGASTKSHESAPREAEVISIDRFRRVRR